ncbi:hypothetical protein LTR17_012717 [Elasticomyces elasticus]|nr:hypothetical protein LTR17_012717 [Elasticomyces elasticus]
MLGGTLARASVFDGRNARCLLFTLPPELRNSIYELVLLSGRKSLMLLSFTPRPTYTDTKDFAPMQVCRRMRQDCLPIYYGGLTLRLTLFPTFSEKLERWISAQSNDAITCTRLITLEDHQHYHSTYPRRHDFVCVTQIMIDLNDLEQPVTEDKEMCSDCGRDQGASMQRVAGIVRTLEQSKNRRFLTKAKLVEICEAAAWPAEEDMDSKDDLEIDLANDRGGDSEEDSADA